MKNTTEEKREAIPNSVSRMLLAGIGVLLQVLWIFWLALKLNDYSTAIQVCTSVLTFLITLRIYGLHINSAYKISWIILILLFPIFGLTIYLLFGRSGAVSVMRRRFGKNMTMLRQYHAPILQQRLALPYPDRITRNHARYLQDRAGYPAYDNTDVTFYGDTCEALEAQKTALRSAEKFIFMEYFIVEEGIMWNTILEILKRKAAEGVEVRFMYDGMCAFDLLPYSYPKKLQKYGINCKMSNKIRPFVSTIQNNRDHRKICVIDGQVGYVGGVNLADEYINEKERFGHWKDTAVLLRGDAVQSLTMIFLQMWDVDMRGVEPYGKYLTKKADTLNEKLGYVIPYADSPFDHENVGEEVYFHILNHAKKYVHIMTPYLILDNEMLTTLIRAAKSGIEVIIIMPHIPDKWYAFAVAKTYYKELIEGGVQIYEYTPGFVHAKIFVSDDDTATVGSINLDFRSLYLHFENGVFIYDNPEVQKVEEDFQNTLAKCHKVTVTEVRNRGILMKTAGQVLRLVAPLM